MSSLVVMSKGTKYTQQSYKVSDSFPYEWIKKKWREAFHVTAMATSGTQVRVGVGGWQGGRLGARGGIWGAGAGDWGREPHLGGWAGGRAGVRRGAARLPALALCSQPPQAPLSVGDFI